MTFAFPLLATFLLTGGRSSEVLGLEFEDLSFDRRTITFRPNGQRRLKTSTSHRTVPMWPQLKEVLREYVFGGQAPISGLLFPSYRIIAIDPETGEPKRTPLMSTDVRKILDAVAERAGWGAGEIRSKMFRHTYTAARLQTVERGEAVAQFKGGRELGHGGDSLVKRVYGHLGSVRHRAQHVEFKLDAHFASVAGFAERVRLLGKVPT
jgi:integrase